MRPILLSCLLLLFSMTVQAQPYAPPPPPKEPTLVTLLERLSRAVEELDEEYILSIVHPDCVVSYGGFQGKDDFREYWFGSLSQGLDFFSELQRALELGGIYVEGGGGYSFPYTSMAPATSPEGIMLGVMLPTKTHVRAWPGLKGRIIGSLGQELVKLCNIEVPLPVDGMDWTCVLLPQGGRGYVASHLIAQPTGLRFLFRPEGSSWWLVSTVAGETP